VVTRGQIYQFDNSTAAEILRDTPQKFRHLERNFRLFCVFQAVLGALSRSRGSAEARVMRDLDRSSTSTGGVRDG
jgi:hypothetical protein